MAMINVFKQLLSKGTYKKKEGKVLVAQTSGRLLQRINNYWVVISFDLI